MTTQTTLADSPPAAPAAPTRRPVRTRGILAIILVSYFLILLDNSVVFTGVPSIRADLHLPQTQLSWVQDAYTLVFGGLLLLGARLGDLLGRRRVFVAGLLVFVIASALVGSAPNGTWLVVARAVQGIGAAIVAPSSLSLLTASFPEGQSRSRAVALYGATAGIGASLGLVVGGAAADWISWRAGFFVNLPIGIAMVLLAPKYLPETETRSGAFDLPGAVLATLGTGALAFSVIDSADHGWTSSTVLVALVSGVTLLVLLVARERRASQPIMPLRLFADRRRVAAYLTRAAYLGAMIGFFFFTSQLMQDTLGFTALQAGLGFLPMTVVNFAVASAVPRLARRWDAASMLATGVGLTLAGMAWLSLAGPDHGYLAAIAAPMLLVGAGQGLAFAPLTSFGIVDAPMEDAGAASGLVNTFHQFGTTMGLAVLVAVSAGAPDAGARFTVALRGSSILLALGLLVVLALLVPAHRRSRTATRRAGCVAGPHHPPVTT
ncbi:MFS transporter [Intrasporangium sp. YIM S08009]|uniref:MFS transporter n=1 Tax=Intrasporangium zincisolvens TaxID=3080018 RepID=UPI002B05A694|nr:MFS transporter [Intrasporangium sp. YIM S08009]